MSKFNEFYFVKLKFITAKGNLENIGSFSNVKNREGNH